MATPKNSNGQLANNQQAANGGAYSSQQQNSTVDEHFAFFKSIYDRAQQLYLVQKAKGTYDFTKTHSFGFVENTLNKVEGRVQDAAQLGTAYGGPIYESYLFPTTDRLYGYYNKSVETSKFAVDKTKSVALTTGTLGLGLAIVATQMGLIAGTAATNIFLDGVISTKNAGGTVLSKGISLEKAAEQYVLNAIQATRQLAKNPTEKATEHANTFLDIANTVFERLLGLPPTQENPEASLTERVSHLAKKIVGGLSNRANTAIVEPAQRQLQTVVEQLRNGLVLVDYVKQRKEWTFQKVDKLSSSVNELRSKLEKEAVEACTTPKVALIRYIRNSSAALNEHLAKLRLKGAEVLTESLSGHVENATGYVEQLDLNFVNADDIYQVKDEVIEEAKQKLLEIAQWTSSLVVGNGDKSSASSTPSTPH